MRQKFANIAFSIAQGRVAAR